MSAALLEIRLGFVDGGHATFAQDDPLLVSTILSRVEPDRVFSQTSLVIGGEHHVSIFPVARIAHVELRSEELPDWPFGTNFERMVLLDAEIFQRRLEDVRDVSRKELKVSAGEDVIGYVAIEARGGFRYRLGLHAKALPSSVRAGRLARLADASVLHARHGENSAFLINLQNAVSYRFYPGTPELPPHAFEAREIVEKDA